MAQKKPKNQGGIEKIAKSTPLRETVQKDRKLHTLK